MSHESRGLERVRAVCQSSLMHRILLTTLLCLLAGPSHATAQSVEELSKGEIFVSTQKVKGYDFPKLKMKAVINAPPAKVYKLISDCDRFKDRMPRVEESKTLKRSPGSHTCEVTVGVPFPMSDLTAITVDRRVAGPVEWSRRWTLAKGVETSYTRNVGAFVLTTFNGDPNRTLVNYEIHAIPKSAVPDFLRKTAQKRSLPGMIKRMREEVAKL